MVSMAVVRGVYGSRLGIEPDKVTIAQIGGKMLSEIRDTGAALTSALSVKRAVTGAVLLAGAALTSPSIASYLTGSFGALTGQRDCVNSYGGIKITGSDCYPSSPDILYFDEVNQSAALLAGIAGAVGITSSLVGGAAKGVGEFLTSCCRSSAEAIEGLDAETATKAVAFAVAPRSTAAVMVASELGLFD